MKKMGSKAGTGLKTNILPKENSGGHNSNDNNDCFCIEIEH